jgi:sporulation protein YlmC with PRC-barrel domain
MRHFAIAVLVGGTLAASMPLAFGQPLDGQEEQTLERPDAPADPLYEAPPTGVQGPAHRQPRRGEIEQLSPLPAQQFDSATVMAVQRRLQDLGYYTGNVTGTAGPAIGRAIEAYQRDNAMPVTGQISPALIADLEPSPLPVTVAEMPVLPEPVVVAWRPRDLIGRTVHSAPGDLIGRVKDVVVGPDGQAAGLLVKVDDLYGLDSSDVVLPWGMVVGRVGREAIVLGLNAEQALAIRNHPHSAKLAEGDWRATRMQGAAARAPGRSFGEVEDLVFDRQGRLDALLIDEGGRVWQVPASEVALAPDHRSVELTGEPSQEAALPAPPNPALPGNGRIY